MQPQAELAKNQVLVLEDDQPEQNDADSNSLFASVNDLPADDPLRAPQQNPAQAAPVAKDVTPTQLATNTVEPSPHPALPTTVFAETIIPEPAETPAPIPPMPVSSPAAPIVNGSVIVNAGKKVAVPSLVGQPVRNVIEQAGAVGLGVQVLGTGIAREQAPVAGTMVPTGTEVVVRFTR
jgi:cell division protein FtsI (penicillin-binding protein 3)